MTGIIFNNVTSLSLGLLRGMEKTSIMEILSWGEDDLPSEAIKRGTTYILMSTLFGNLLRWSLGAYLLKRDESEDEELIIPNLENNNNDSKNTAIIIPSSSLENVTVVDERTPLIYNDSSERSSLKNIVPRIISQDSIIRIILNKINEIMNPPLYAALIALLVGITPPIKALFFGDDAPFYLTITHTMEYLGSMAIPLTLITLGAQLRNLPRTRGQEMMPAINYVMACRFLVMPIIGITTILLTRSWYISDPMFWFVLILLACGPPAVNCMNLTQLTGTFQEEMATLLFYSYIAVVPMITMLLMVILTIISKVASE
ncbi:11722_t:CDS:2 [Entrophospora sp. SA101]|nr:11722_t:CDS:2 [Entrophospora sp. SA101]